MRIRVGARTDIGRMRQRNEDAYLVQEPLFAVADGMGGHRGGNVASTLVVETLGEMPAETTSDGPLPYLVKLIQQANRRVLERGESDRDLRGMGTTITAIIADPTDAARAHIAHVGDSRAYLLRDGALTQLTEDHTLVQRMVREGRLRPEEAELHPQRSILTRALGVDEEVTVDQLTLDVHPGDRLLLCTDGLSSMVSRERIHEVLENEHDPDRAAALLVEEANQGGGEDNITVVVVEFVDEKGDGGKPRTRAVDGPVGTDAGQPAQQGTEAATATLTTAGPDESPEEEAPAGETRGIRWRRLLVWAAVLLLVVVVGAVAGRIYLDNQWYVGDAEGRVAIYNGIPTQVLGVRLSEVEEVTEIQTADAMQFEPWTGLPSGVTANSAEEARAIVEQIRSDVRGAEGDMPG